jgi:hypothetical protein
VPTYRYYCLDGVGQIHSAEWFEAGSDEEAVAVVAMLRPGGKCEVWRGNTLIGSTSPQQEQRRA